MPRSEEHRSPLRALEAGEAEQLAERMAVFATASRLRLLYALATRERSVDELAERTGLAPSAISQQLRVLRHLRFVIARRDGRRMIYRLHDEHIADLLAAIRHWLAAIIRTRAGQRLDSPALIADGHHARADAYVSLAVIASATAVALGVPVADPLIGLAITLVILRITWQSWQTIHAGHTHQY